MTRGYWCGRPASVLFCFCFCFIFTFPDLDTDSSVTVTECGDCLSHRNLLGNMVRLFNPELRFLCVIYLKQL